MKLRAFSALVAGVAVAGCTLAAAPALADSSQRQTNVDLTRKRAADRTVLRRIYTKAGSRPYYVQVRRDGKVSYRRLWRNTKRRLGNAKASQDLPGFLQRLEAWRAQKGGRR